MAWFHTRLARLVGTRYPMIQAPMAGVNTPELVAAVSEAGGLGSRAARCWTPTPCAEQLGAVRAITSAPFAVNLFAALTTPEAPEAVGSMLERLGAPARTARARPGNGATFRRRV